MKFLLGCNMKIVIQSMGEWTLAGGGGESTMEWENLSRWGEGNE